MPPSPSPSEARALYRPTPVFFSEKVAAAIEGKTDDEALQIIASMIADTQFAKQEGSGPPQDEINQARRLFLNIYARLYGRPDHVQHRA